MIESENKCCFTHFLKALHVVLPDKDEILVAFQLPEAIDQMQDLFIRYLEQTNKTVFDENILFNIGKNYLKQGDFNSAVKIFQTNTVQYPEVVRSWEGLALAHSLMNNISQALTYYSEALELDPSDCHLAAIISALSQRKLHGECKHDH